MELGLAKKRILVIGVANDKSIAWGIAESLHRAGAELILTYVNEAIEKRLRPLADSIGCKNVFPCDVSSDTEIDNLFAEIESRWGSIDGVVHSVAFADREDLQGRACEISRKGFQLALDISAYSLIAVAGRAQKVMPNGGSIITMSYLGSDRVVDNYNIMGVAKAALEAAVRYLAYDLGAQGVRVNAVSAGPIKTLAAAGIPRFKELLAKFADRAPLKRNTTQEDIAGTSVFLLSPLAVGITGETVFVDCGYNIMGV